MLPLPFIKAETRSGPLLQYVEIDSLFSGRFLKYSNKHTIITTAMGVATITIPSTSHSNVRVAVFVEIGI
jgi:hypothetical protein